MSDFLLIVGTIALLLGLPRVVWVIARRQGATDRRYIVQAATAIEFVVFGIGFVVFKSSWIGLLFAAQGLVQLYLVRSIRRTSVHAESATPAV
jgi:hypothetical protein